MTLTVEEFHYEETKGPPRFYWQVLKSKSKPYQVNVLLTDYWKWVSLVAKFDHIILVHTFQVE